MLVKFDSKVGGLTMFGDVAVTLLKATGNSGTVPGALLAKDIPPALQRLKAGEFGTCSDCRCRISDARLRALPFAGRCVACQERRDMAAGWRERIASAPTGSLWQ